MSEAEKNKQLKMIPKGKVAKVDHNLGKITKWISDNSNQKTIDLIYLFQRYQFAYLTYGESLRGEASPQDMKVMNKVDKLLKKYKLGTIEELKLPDLFKEYEGYEEVLVDSLSQEEE